MDLQRNGLIAAMVVVLGVLFVQWNEFKSARAPVEQTASEETLLVPGLVVDQPNTPVEIADAIPEIITDEAVAAVEAELTETNPSARLVDVKTDVLEVTIDTLGGDIIRAALPKHLASLEVGAQPFVILNRTRQHTYVAQSGLIGPDGTDGKQGRPQFSVAKARYELTAGQAQLEVALRLVTGDVTITKTFIFRRGDYLINLDYQVQNNSESEWRAHLFGQIQRDASSPQVSNAMSPRPYLGMALTTNEENYKKVDFEDLDEGPVKAAKSGGWVAMVQHYFVSAWVPDQDHENQFQLRKLGNQDLYAAGFTGPVVAVPAGGAGRLTAGFYVGPKNQQGMGMISPYLDLTIDYGWLWWIAKPLFAGLELINKVLNNWGWSIIVLTIVVKLLFFPLSAASYRSMARMRKLQPEMLRLRELYGDDRQKLSQETMGLYKKEKVNPLGGCLPMLVQMPVFIALYWVLNESVELRHAPWILWINDLSVKDPFYVLPVLNAISMFILQTLQPAPPDPTQAKVMKAMPIAFGFFFMFFPAGLVLYWTVNSILSIAQQWAITRKIDAA